MNHDAKWMEIVERLAHISSLSKNIKGWIHQVYWW